jgi:uncharacterized membrane protein
MTIVGRTAGGNMQKATNSSGFRKARSVEAAGFFAGANNVPKESAEVEIDSQTEVQKEAVNQLGVRDIRALEGKSKTLSALADAAQQRWQELRQKHGDAVPRFFKPLMLLTGSVAAILSETYLLAPMLDMIGIANPDYQLWTAVGIIAAASGLVHYCLEKRQQVPQARWPIFVAAGVFVGLVAVGLFRAEQMAFGAIASGSLFGNFLKEHPILRCTVMVFLTLLFPVSATLVPHAALEELHNWWEYRRARSRAVKFTRRANETEKALEARREKLTHQLIQLDGRAEELKAAYATYHKLGEEVGASQRPRWTVWLKTAAVAGLTFLVCLSVAYLLGGVTTAAVLLSALASVISAAIALPYFHHRWNHPSPRQYLRQANSQFRSRNVSKASTNTQARSSRTVPVQAPEKSYDIAVEAMRLPSKANGEFSSKEQA